MIRVAIIDDHPIVREGLIAALDGEREIRVVGAVGSVEELISHATSWVPDIILLDFEIPGMAGVEAVRALVHQMPEARIVVFTAYADDDKIVGAVRAGARGYLLKGVPAAEVAGAIQEVHAGGSYLPGPIAAALARQVREPRPTSLSERERDVVRLVSEGLSNKQIARRLAISERTVKFHVNSVMIKLGAENRAQASAIAIRRRLL
jgi:DNA-binding NarL/FixJ family response regulator